MSIGRSVQEHARDTPDHPALIIADGSTLTYSSLQRQIDGVAHSLSDLGATSSDTIGIVLRDGPEMALAFLGTSAVCAAAPLNPSYRETEFLFEIDDLGLAALLVGTGHAEVAAATAAATAAGIPVIRVASTIADGFELSVTGPAIRGRGDRRNPQADNVALVLHTSGTTARPKIVPLSHNNLMASAEAIRQTLNLQNSDTVCNVMPLFHIHGLIAGLCTSLVAGCTVVATPGFSAPDMGRWLNRHEATWYTAVPTMHQALLERARQHPEEFAGANLRFVRSSSASLPPSVMADLEAEFDCPVVEAYGMTEAAHQMSCNPLPPSERKPGSVGVAAGPKIAIMDDGGQLLAADEIGEVVIAGSNVMAGYQDNDQANGSAFTDGWFRTGDQGRIDTDGYLFLTGRLKEIINRGGEKISPREVDEVLLGHPAVTQVVTFAVEDVRLGEQVAAAVVLADDGQATTERSMREYVATLLAPYKVPRKIVVLDSIPKGPSGKMQRIGLAEKLGLSDLDARERTAAYVEPTSPGELLMAELWTDALGVTTVSADQHFLDAGGDSLVATRLLARVREEVDVEVSMIDFFDAPTISEQGALVEALLLAEDGTP